MRSSVAILGGLFLTLLAIALVPVAPHTQSLVGPLTIAATQGRDLDHATSVIRRLQYDGNPRLVAITSDPLAPGKTHQRFVQLHQNVRVLGGGVSVQSDFARTTSLFGHIYPNIAIATEPRLTLQNIVAMADRPGITLMSTPELAVVFDPSTDVYRFVHHVRTFGTNGLVLSEIDALTGMVITQRNALTTQAQSSPCEDCAVGEGSVSKVTRRS